MGEKGKERVILRLQTRILLILAQIDYSLDLERYRLFFLRNKATLRRKINLPSSLLNIFCETDLTLNHMATLRKLNKEICDFFFLRNSSRAFLPRIIMKTLRKILNIFSCEMSEKM